MIETRKTAIVALLVLCRIATADASPLTLYDTAREATPIAPVAPAPPCGGFAVACSPEPGAKPVPPVPAATRLPFDYGMSVAGMVGGGNHGSFAGGAVSGWIAAKDFPVTVYFDYERLQPIGGRR